ncbi:MAG TPA: GNAT family N-acetyltransferase [Telluria sp.]|nr:GNAT family N-acetyltransferase [Telluria sp.]
MTLTIRPATPEDAPAACAVLRRSITECCELDHKGDPGKLDAWLGNKTPVTVAGWFSAPNNYALVAEYQGQVVGVALINQAGKISLCYVVREALGLGIGRALLCGLEEQARRWGVSMLKLHSTATASGFYAHMGYISAGREKSCWGLDCEFFWKQLNADNVCATSTKRRFCPCTGQ